MWRLLTAPLCAGRLFLGEVVIKSLAGKSLGGPWAKVVLVEALSGSFLKTKKKGDSDA